MTNEIKSYWEVLAPHFELINIYEGPEKLAESISTVPRSAVLLYAAHMCQSEVHNGGFLQLFWNNTGIIVPDAVEAYKTIGMPTLAFLVEQAAQPLGSPYPLDRDDRWDALLVASHKSEDELKAIFDAEDNLYIAFEKATRALQFDDLNRRFWDTIKNENGGFEAVATRYTQGPFLLQ